MPRRRNNSFIMKKVAFLSLFLMDRAGRGKTRYYRQWVEDGRTKSVYLKESEVEDVRRQIERRRELVKMLRPYGVAKKRQSRLKSKST